MCLVVCISLFLFFEIKNAQKTQIYPRVGAKNIAVLSVSLLQIDDNILRLIRVLYRN